MLSRPGRQDIQRGKGKSSLGESLPLRAFSGPSWRSATATTNASGLARSSRRVAAGLGTDSCWCWHGPATRLSPSGFCQQQDVNGAFDLGISLEFITTFLKKAEIQHSLLTTLVYTAQTGSKSRQSLYFFLFFSLSGNGENLLSVEGK